MLETKFLCMLNRHRPKRSAVEWDGRTFVGTCRNCNAPIRRLERGGWRAAKDVEST
jgi:hypothetical protein